MNNKTFLTDLSKYNPEQSLRFSEPQTFTTGGNDPKAAKISTKRINLYTVNEDGEEGRLIIPLSPNLHSYGVQENTGFNSDKLSGYSMPIELWSRQPTPEEKQWVENFYKIVDCCKNYVVENKEAIEMYELVMSDLKKFDPLWWKKEKGVLVPDKGPRLYGKLLAKKKDGMIDKIYTVFYNNESNELIPDPRELMGCACTVNAALLVESIFVGTVIKLQVKLYQVGVTVRGSFITKLDLPKPPEQSRIELKQEMPMSDDKEDDGSKSPPIKRKRVVKK